MSFSRRPGLVFVLISLWLGLEDWALGPFSRVRYYDMWDGTFPLYSLLTSGVLGPGNHHWLPAAGCGVDRLANGYSLVQFPMLLFWALPAWAAYQAYVLLHYFLSGYFTYRLCADFLKTSPKAAIFAGAATALASDFSIFFAYSALPLFLWSFEKLLDSPRGRGLAGAALLGSAFSFCSAPAPAVLPFYFIWTFVWFIAVRSRFSLRFLALYAVFAACSIPAHIQSMWAMWANAGLSHRAQWTGEVACGPAGMADALGQTLSTLVGFGLWSLLPAAAGLASLDRKSAWPARCWAMLLFTVAATGVGWWVKGCVGGGGGSLGDVVRGVHWHRFCLFFPLATALCGAYGIQAMEKKRWFFPLVMGMMAAFSAYSKKKSFHEYFFQGGYTANFRSPVLQGLAAGGSTEPFRVATFTHGLFPAYAHAYGLETVDGYLSLYAKSYHEFWWKVIEPVMKRERHMERKFLDWGNWVYLYFRSVDDWPGGVPFKENYRLNLLSLANMKYVISRHPLLDDRLKLLAPQRPWKGMTRWERARLRMGENFGGKRYFYIYENLSCFPRAFFARGLRLFGSREALWDSMGKASLEELQGTVFAEKGRGAGGGNGRGYRKATVTMGPPESDRVGMAVELDGPGILVVSNNFSPFWRCSVDGKPRSMFPAYGTFWGVALDKGDRSVEFLYEPPYADLFDARAMFARLPGLPGRMRP